ncbi:LysR family transcriptional regulator [Massilia eurypsychrophila]|uniref:LysR family transcriptional regulator n=1 Tax=Massilia eurypsychrophila TaxID=1485217 RepID=A0A2G8TBW5_9BURK|nr:LysR family transcriptional regulator [Massilia eurypsychrophila]PIL43168.1 LysR family transcriptional regulator [Massilia eurypsychrophila]
MEINVSARDIRAFLAVADTLSFSQAAQQMHLSQSALSTLIARLEDAFGTRLFDRTTRAVALTAAGEVLASHADQLLSDIERTVTAVRDVSALRRGRVALAALPSLAARIVPRLFRAFGEQYPDITLSLADTLSEPAFELVREGRVDFAITAANPTYRDLDYIPLTTDTFVLLASRGHPLGQVSGAVRLVDTLAFPHISMSRHTSVRQYVEAAALQNGIGFHPAFEIDHLATIGAMVVEQLGVAALPTMAADVISADGLVRRPLVDPVIRRSIGVVKRRERSLSPAAEAMLALLKRQIDT